MTSEEWSRLRYFKATEFNEPSLMDFQFLRGLDRARHIAGVPFSITSSIRRDRLFSPHATGKAVDIRCYEARTRFRIVSGLLAVGFTRLGVYDRHIHVDSDDGQASDVLWTGVSK